VSPKKDCFQNPCVLPKWLSKATAGRVSGAPPNICMASPAREAATSGGMDDGQCVTVGLLEVPWKIREVLAGGKKSGVPKKNPPREKW